MTTTTEYAHILPRRDLAATWASVNPVPLQGEECLETDTGKMKRGNGTTAYTALPYLIDVAGVDVKVATQHASDSSTYVPLAGGHVTGPLYIRAANDTDPVVIKPLGDGTPAVFNLIHNDTTGFILHMVHGPDSATQVGLLGLGVGAVAGAIGIVCDISAANCAGIKVDTFAGSEGSACIGASATVADVIGVNLNQSAANGVKTGPMLKMTVNNTTPPIDQQILDIRSVARIGYGAAGAQIMDILAYSGRTTFWDAPVLHNGGEIIASAYDPDYDGYGVKSQTGIKANAVTVRTETGDGHSLWSHRLTTSGAEAMLQSSEGANKDAETWVSTIRTQAWASTGGLGFFGTAPQVKPTGVAVTAAGVHAALVTLGLIAA